MNCCYDWCVHLITIAPEPLSFIVWSNFTETHHTPSQFWLLACVSFSKMLMTTEKSVKPCTQKNVCWTSDMLTLIRQMTRPISGTFSIASSAVVAAVLQRRTIPLLRSYCWMFWVVLKEEYPVIILSQCYSFIRPQEHQSVNLGMATTQ